MMRERLMINSHRPIISENTKIGNCEFFLYGMNANGGVYTNVCAWRLMFGSIICNNLALISELPIFRRRCQAK